MDGKNPDIILIIYLNFSIVFQNFNQKGDVKKMEFNQDEVKDFDFSSYAMNISEKCSLL